VIRPDTNVDEETLSAADKVLEMMKDKPIPAGAVRRDPPPEDSFEGWSRADFIARIRDLETLLRLEQEHASNLASDLAYARDDLNDHRRRDSGGYQGNF
jgi:hypothetical protein